jgi:hypothetical protein
MANGCKATENNMSIVCSQRVLLGEENVKIKIYKTIILPVV